MRVLLSPFFVLKSHLYLMAPLAWALRSAGHEVRVACRPELVDAAAGIGLTAVQVGREPADPRHAPGAAGVDLATVESESDDLTQDDYGRDDPYLELCLAVEGTLRPSCTRAVLDDLVGFARAWKPDLVVWDGLSYPGAVAARASRAAHARLLVVADALLQLRGAWREEKGDDPRPDPLRKWLTPLLKRYECEFDEELIRGQWTIDAQPPWARTGPGPVEVSMRPISCNGPTVVPRWLDTPPERPRVCATTGGSYRGGLSHEITAEVVIDAVADLDVDVIATFTEKEVSRASLPDNVRAVDHVPLAPLLSSCAAAIHHGGLGTVVSAWEHGVPQLIVPGIFGNNRWYGPLAYANGLQAQGAGVNVGKANRVTPQMLRQQLLRVLDNGSFRTNAERLRTEALGLPTPAEVVPALERLTGAHRKGTVDR